MSLGSLTRAKDGMADIWLSLPLLMNNDMIMTRNRQKQTKTERK
jgi:hypothetical protein